MKIYPVDLERLFLLVAFVLVFEITRLLLGYALGREKGRVKLIEKRLRVLADLSLIKSEQQQLVEFSLLTREKISLDKELEKLKEDFIESRPKWKKLFRAIRIIVYAAAAFYFTSTPLVMVDTVLFWPLVPFASSCSMVLSTWSILPIASFAIRHLLRAAAPLLTSEEFP